MSAGDTPIRFIAESIGSYLPDFNVLEQSTPEMKDSVEQQANGKFLCDVLASHYKYRSTIMVPSLDY